MGGLIFALFAGLYFWLPKITGRTLTRTLSLRDFRTLFSLFNLTFFPRFPVGLLGQPRRVFEYAQNLQTLNDISSISAFFLGASFIFFIVNFVYSIYISPKWAPPNPWRSRGLEWQTPTPVPWFNFERIPVVLDDPYHYGERDAPPVADLGRELVSSSAGGGGSSGAGDASSGGGAGGDPGGAAR
jgi:cytochrome c oxidase subunit 1